MENKRGSLSTVFLVIAIILIVVMGVFMYMQKTEADRQIAELENNATKLQETIKDLQEKIDNISNTINGSETANNTEDKTTANNVFNNEYKSLKELALLKISSEKLTKKEEIYEYDFNKDGIKEKITLKQTEDENVYSIYYGNQQISDGIYEFNVYVVDLDESDKYLDLILSEIAAGGGYTDYHIYINDGMALNKLEYTTEKTITGDNEGNNFYVDKKNNFILLGDVEASLDQIITNTYYSIKDNVIYSIKIENIENNETYKVKREDLNFAKDLNKATIEYTNENLKIGTELQIIEWLKGPDGQEIIKVKLSSGEVGYIYENYA